MLFSCAGRGQAGLQSSTKSLNRCLEAAQLNECRLRFPMQEYVAPVTHFLCMSARDGFAKPRIVRKQSRSVHLVIVVQALARP